MGTSTATAPVPTWRNRLARDIHDTLAQDLAIIIRQLEIVASTGGGPASMGHVAIATEIARGSLTEARRSIRALRPALLDNRTLEGALQDLVQRSRRLTVAEIHWRPSGSQVEVPCAVSSELLGIVQEALTNALKHAGASIIDVGLWSHGGVVSLSIHDNGAGFDPAIARNGVGLASMRERADRIGATLTIASEPGSGTEVVVS